MEEREKPFLKKMFFPLSKPPSPFPGNIRIGSQDFA
jgi:hypothetical protein